MKFPMTTISDPSGLTSISATQSVETRGNVVATVKFWSTAPVVALMAPSRRRWAPFTDQKSPAEIHRVPGHGEVAHLPCRPRREPETIVPVFGSSFASPGSRPRSRSRRRPATKTPDPFDAGSTASTTPFNAGVNYVLIAPVFSIVREEVVATDVGGVPGVAHRREGAAHVHLLPEGRDRRDDAVHDVWRVVHGVGADDEPLGERVRGDVRDAGDADRCETQSNYEDFGNDLRAMPRTHHDH